MSELLKITSREFLERVCNQLELEPSLVRRVVIDADLQRALKIYVDYFGDSRILNVEMPAGLEVVVAGNLEPIKIADRNGLDDVSVDPE